MTRHLTFYFDPLCPYAWLTSLWAREVRRSRDLDIEWRFLSLTRINDRSEDSLAPLRIAALARREGGNEAVDRAYLALGRAIHERKAGPRDPERFREVARETLAEVGLSPALVERALEDDSTRAEVVAEHDRAVDRYGAFGVPWLVLGDDEYGYFGPVVAERLRGEQALELWEHFTWLVEQPYLYELKRSRSQLPPLDGLSQDLVEMVPTPV